MSGYRFGDSDSFDDSGGFDDNAGDDSSFDTQNGDNQDDAQFDEDDPDAADQDPDENPDESDEEQDANAGNNGDGDYDNYSDDDFPPVDDDVYASAENFPNADETDFEDDPGDWNADDYTESATNLFGDHEFFGDNIVQQKIDEGYQPYKDPAFARGFDEIAPGTSDSVQLFERNGRLVAFGFISAAVLEMLAARYRGIDLSNLEVAVPPKGEPVPPQPLPAAFANVVEAPSVDLRKYCTPIGDQRQTSRCSAFAWTHANEMSRNILQREPVRLSPTYTMYEFQQMQGDVRDYRYAWKGGDGTCSGPEPGQLLTQYGTCRQQLWPDDSPQPTAHDEQLAADAQQFPLEGTPWPISIDDVRRVLSAGCPVHVSMNTGTAFAQVGRDGLFNAAEAPSGTHGRHAMLIVGYIGNFFIVKNSWGADWGDQGYCYVPKKVLAESDPELIAILVKRGNA